MNFGRSPPRHECPIRGRSRSTLGDDRGLCGSPRGQPEPLVDQREGARGDGSVRLLRASPTCITRHLLAPVLRCAELRGPKARVLVNARRPGRDQSRSEVHRRCFGICIRLPHFLSFAPAPEILPSRKSPRPSVLEQTDTRCAHSFASVQCPHYEHVRPTCPAARKACQRDVRAPPSGPSRT